MMRTSISYHSVIQLKLARYFDQFLHKSGTDVTQSGIDTTQKKGIILIVDDEEAILRVVGIKLKVSCYQVVIARNGQQALELIETSCRMLCF